VLSFPQKFPLPLPLSPNFFLPLPLTHNTAPVVLKGDLLRFCVADYKYVEILVLQKQVKGREILI
jgi:hypothetical protein